MDEELSGPPEDTIFDTAKSIVYGDRERTYGDPSRNIRNIAAMWTTYLKCRYDPLGLLEYPPNVTMEDVCAMMRMVKESRLINQPDHRDSLVDICGYAGVQGRIKETKT